MDSNNTLHKRISTKDFDIKSTKKDNIEIQSSNFPTYYCSTIHAAPPPEENIPKQKNTCRGKSASHESKPCFPKSHFKDPVIAVKPPECPGKKNFYLTERSNICANSNCVKEDETPKSPHDEELFGEKAAIAIKNSVSGVIGTICKKTKEIYDNIIKESCEDNEVLPQTVQNKTPSKHNVISAKSSTDLQNENSETTNLFDIVPAPSMVLSKIYDTATSTFQNITTTIFKSHGQNFEESRGYDKPDPSTIRKPRDAPNSSDN